MSEIRDFVVERSVNFPVDEPREVRLEVVRAAGAGDVRGWAAVVNGQGRAAGEERLHIRGVVGGGGPEPITPAVGKPPLPFAPMIYRDDAPMWHGGSFRTLKGLFFDRSGGWANLTAPLAADVAAPRGDRGWSVPVALLDGCIVACAVYSYVLCNQRVEVPLGWERLQLAAQPRAREICTARLWFRDQDPEYSRYDLTLAGDDGRLLLAIDGLRLAVLPTPRGALS